MPLISFSKIYSSSETAAMHVQEDSKSYQKYQRRKDRTKKALHRLQEQDILLMDLKVDYAFKQLFGNEKNKDITVVFLNAILSKSGRAPIEQLYFQNIEIGGEYENDKKSRLDLLIKTENKEWVNIEIQMNNAYNMVQRTLYYWSRLFSDQLKKGQSYKELYPVISINIMHFNMIHETDAYHNIFRLYEMNQKYPLTDRMELHFVEIPKLITAWKNHQLDPWEDVLTRWLLLLGTVDRKINYFYDDIYQELEEIAMKDKSLQTAMRVWEDLSRTEEERQEYEVRLKQIVDEQSKKRDRELLEQEMAEMRTEKKEIEMQKQEAEMQKQEAEMQKQEAEAALKETTKQIVLKMLKQGVEHKDIAEVMNLTTEQLKSIQQEMKNNDI